MGRKTDWRDYIDDNGDFELARYLYATNLDLMKNALDLGTLLSTDPVRLRAYKEQVKSVFKARWLETAQALESFDIIVPCGCANNEYCKICGGARYRLNTALSPDQMREISVVVGGADPKLQARLEEGLARALEEVERENGRMP